MGKVVKLEPAAQNAAGTRRRRPRRSKTALVLGGGGFTGGVYEIGALRALDLLSVNRTVNQFDVYVGTSAGSFVAALAANGVTPEEMMRVVNQQVPTPFRDINLGQLLRPNLGEYLKKGAALPFKTLGVLRELAPLIGQVSIMDVALGLAEGLPSGIYSGSGIEDYMRAVLSDPDRSDDFRLLEQELYLAATDLDTCERIVFGANDWDDVPISTAVRASTALPMVYKPVRVRDRELVDGGIVSTTNVDIAVEAGAKFIVVVNPLVPYVNDFTERVSGLFGGPLPGRRHRAHRARAQRRADVPDLDHELHQAHRHRPPRLPVGHAEARRGLRQLPRRVRAPRHRDLRHAGAQGGQALRRRAGEDARLAQDPRADDGHAAAAVGLVLLAQLPVRRGVLTGACAV
jgi:predicted acylesterase/phospholipase RssA